MFKNKIFNSSSEEMSEIPDESINLVVTSPPYNIDIKYGNKWENRKVTESKSIKYQDNLSEEDYQKLMNKVIKECIRVLHPEGTIFFNMKNRLIDDQIYPPFWVFESFKDLYLKNIIIWNFDWGGATSRRFSSRYEYIFFFSKDKKEWTFNLDEISIPSVNFRPDRYKSQYKNPSDVWKIPLVSGNSLERTDHPAQYPEKMIERIIKAVTNKGDLVLDPFMGSGTSAVVAKRLGRDYVGYEINNEYIEIANKRLEIE